MLRIAFTMFVLIGCSQCVSAQQVMRTFESDLIMPTTPQRIIPDFRIVTSFELWVSDNRTQDEVGFWLVFEYEDGETIEVGPFETEDEAWEELAEILASDARDTGRMRSDYVSVEIVEFLPEYFYVETFDSLEEAEEIAEIFEAEDLETQILTRYGKRR